MMGRAAHKQTEIDFARGHQLALIREAELPVGKGRDGVGVKPGVLRAVLRCIDDHGRGAEAWLSYATLSRESDVKPRQARRAVESLVAMSLICVERKRIPGRGDRVTCNHYRIVWSELELLRRQKPKYQVALAADQVAFLGDQVALQGHQSAPEAPLEAPPLPPDPESPGTDGEWQRVADKFRGKLVSVNALAQQARAQGFTPAEFHQRVLDAFATATLPQNARLIDKPNGAVGWFLRNGEWPVEGVATLADVAAECRRRDEAAADAAAHRERVAENERRCQELESEYGPVLDRMTFEEIDALVGPGTPMAKAARHSPRFVRSCLLVKLEERQHANA
jgi:hypothetical protein